MNKKVKILCLAASSLAFILSPIQVIAEESAESIQYGDDLLNWIISYENPADIYSEDYPNEELIITNYAWINRAINELSSGLPYMSFRGDDISYSDNYDARRLDEGVFNFTDYSDNQYQFQSIKEDGRAIFRINMLLIENTRKEDFYRFYANLMRIMQTDITDDELIASLDEYLDSGESFELGDVKVTQLSLGSNPQISVERDLTEEIADGAYPDLVEGVPSEDIAQIELSPEIFAERAATQQREQDEDFKAVNDSIVYDLMPSDYYERFSFERISADEMPDIYSENYPTINQPIVNREWTNRMIIEMKRNQDMKTVTPGLYVFQVDSNTTYYQPNNEISIYMFSGKYESRDVSEIQLVTENREKDFEEMADLVYEANENPETQLDFTTADYENKLYVHFYLLAKLMQHELSESDIQAGFKQFIESDTDFTMGDVLVRKNGYLDGVIYFSRDLTDEIESGVYPPYSDRLPPETPADPLIKMNQLELGKSSWQPPFLDPKYGIDETIGVFDSYNEYRNLMEEIYSMMLKSYRLTGEIEAIELDDNGVTLTVYSANLNGPRNWDILIPADLSTPNLIVGDIVQFEARYVGFHEDENGQLRHHGIVTSLDTFIVNPVE